MDEILLKIKSGVGVFLSNDDFVVKGLIETESEMKFLIISNLDNINQISTVKNKANNATFLELLVEALSEFKLTDKKISIDTEVMYGR